MNARTYGTIMRVIAVTLAAAIAVSIVREMPPYVPLISVMVALAIASVCRRFVREIMTDERNHRIDEKAAALSYRVYVVVTAAFALVVMVFRTSLPSWAGIAGETMAYSICGLMLMHLATSKYYGAKL